jgi:hypothetical protein
VRNLISGCVAILLGALVLVFRPGSLLRGASYWAVSGVVLLGVGVYYLVVGIREL